MTRDEILALVDGARDELVALCQDLVRLPTVNTGVMPTGDETPAAELLRAKLAAEGIEAHVYESAPNRGNLIARLPGSGGAPRLLLLSHTDVVPVEDEAQWRFPPFSATVHEGRVWGRGAGDMKSTVAAQAMAMILLKRAGLPLAGDLIFAAGADEESGGDWGFRWLAEHHADELRADYGLNEGGGGLVQAADGRMAYLVSTGEKGRLEIQITIKGRGWHASQPWRADNAIYKAQEVIRRIAAYQPERHVDPALIGPLADLYGIREEITAENVDRIAAELETREVTWASTLRALTRMTLVATMIDAGVKSNSVAETCLVTCDVRTLPHQDDGYVRDQLTALFAGLEGVSFAIRYTAVPSDSPYDEAPDGFAARVQAATRAALGRDDLLFVPSLTVGFTDSRLVRGLTPVIYGFLPRHPADDPRLGGAHNINESASIESMVLTTKLFAAVAYDLLREH
jgi:acetylornithine deacetylase/succinyl-diaminopimelate desuccinylase-like protein